MVFWLVNKEANTSKEEIWALEISIKKLNFEGNIQSIVSWGWYLVVEKWKVDLKFVIQKGAESSPKFFSPFSSTF